MDSVKKWVIHHYFWLLLGIVFFAFITRIYRLSYPPQYMFDEVYHAVTAKLIRRNDPRAFEWWNPPPEPNTAVDWLHPPLAKYTQALGMDIFGENSFGWRISSVIFGTLLIFATAKLAEELFDDKVIALVAAFLAACDGLLLTQSRIAMNDIHVAFFIVVTFLFYMRFRKAKRARRTLWLFLTGLSAGLAMGSKWSGIFILGVVWVAEIFRFRPILLKRKNIFPGFLRVVFLLAVPATVYILSYTQMFLQGKTLICTGNQVEQGKCYCSQESSTFVTILKRVDPSRSNYWESLEARGGCKQLLSHFSELHHQILWYQLNLKATHPFQSRPWQWFFDIRPVWFYVDYQQQNIANIYALGNPLLFWIGDVAVGATIVYLLYVLKRKYLHHGKIREKWSNLLLLLFAYFAVWLPWQLSPRIMFFYHYTPAVPLLSILLAYWLSKLSIWKSGKVLSITFVALIFLTFVIFYPDWTGISVPKQFAEKVYFAMPSWR